MLPGFVAGYYDFDECHVDLARLASMCRVNFVHATAKNIDTKVRSASRKGPWQAASRMSALTPH